MANIIRVGGGGSGGSATLITKSITQNGTYLAQDDNADGYSEVEVDVAGHEVDKVYFQNSFAKGATPLTITLLETANKTSHIKLTGSVWAPSIPTGYTATTGTISNNRFTTTETSEYHWDYVQEFDITCGNDNAVIVYNGGLNNMSEVSLNVYHIYNLASKSITQNGTYSVQDDGVDGYAEVIVDVSGGTPIITDLISTPATSASTEPFSNSEYTSELAAWKAFDKSSATFWASANGTNHYIGYKFASAVVVNRVYMKIGSNSGWEIKQAPALWEIQGSNDDGTTWVTINTYSHYWTTIYEEFVYDFDNTDAYKWLRVLVKRTMEGTRGCASLAELDFYNVSYVNTVEFKNYLKFNEEGIILPWTINSDYKVEVTFYDTTYYNDRAVIGNDNSASYFHITEFSNRYYYQTSYNSESSFGPWSAGEHTVIYNDENGKISFDGTVVGNSNIPDNNSVHYQIGGRGSRTSVQAYKGYIKDCKIYSKSTGTLLYHLRPAEVLGLSCLYEEVTRKLFSNPTVVAVDSIT